MDAAQGHVAGQIAVFQFVADDFAAQIHVPGLDMAEMYRLTRLADALTQTVFSDGTLAGAAAIPGDASPRRAGGGRIRSRRVGRDLVPARVGGRSGFWRGPGGKSGGQPSGKRNRQTGGKSSGEPGGKHRAP